MTYPPGVCHMVSVDLGEYNRPLRFQYNVDRGIVCHESFESCPPESRVSSPSFSLLFSFFFFFLTILSKDGFVPRALARDKQEIFGLQICDNRSTIRGSQIL